MRPPHYRVARLEVRYRRDDLLPTLEVVLSSISRHAEAVGLFLAVCALWGLIAYTALASVALT